MPHIARCPTRPSVSNILLAQRFSAWDRCCRRSTTGKAVCRDGLNGRSLFGRIDRTGARHPRMNTQQRLGAVVTDLDLRGVNPHHDLAADGRRPRGVIAAIDAHSGVVADGPDNFGEASGRRAIGNGRRCGFSSWNMASTWRRSRPWMRLEAQFSSQCLKNSFWASSVSKRRPASAVPWVCWIAFSTLPFRLGSPTRAGRRQHRNERASRYKPD